MEIRFENKNKRKTIEKLYLYISFQWLKGCSRVPVRVVDSSHTCPSLLSRGASDRTSISIPTKIGQSWFHKYARACKLV